MILEAFLITRCQTMWCLWTGLTCQTKDQQGKSFEKNSARRIQCLAGPPWQRKEDDVSGRRGFGAAGAEAAVRGTVASCAALGEEDGPEVREEPSRAPHFQCGEGKVPKQPRGNKSLIRGRLNWTGHWSKPACSGDGQGLPLARRRRPEEQPLPPPSPPRRRRGPCVTGGDGAAATGEDAAGAEGGSNAQAPPSPAWMLSQGTQEKKNQQFIERRSYSLSGYPTPTDILMANHTEGKRKHEHRLDQISLWITFSVKCMDLAFPCSCI